MMSILLIYPPFGAIGCPYISIPTLGAYLRSKGIAVKAVDANNEFYRGLLTPHRIRAARSLAETALKELNHRPQLALTDTVRFARLMRALSIEEEDFREMEKVLDPDAPLSPRERMRLIHAAIRLVCAPYFPESVECLETHNIITYCSPFRKFSSRDVLQSTKREGLLSGFFESLLTPLLSDSNAPGIVGISASFPDQIEAAFRCARVIKAIKPHIHVVLGGAFVSCHMRNVREPKVFDLFDSLVLDDGEIPLERLYTELSGPNPDLARVPGLVYRSGGAICRNAPAPALDMESLPPPAYELLPLERYLLPRRNMPLPLRLSKGCNWRKCAFCRTRMSMIHQHQQPSPDYLFEQLRATMETTGNRIFFFTDDSASPQVMEDLSKKIIEADLRIKWVVNFRFDPRLTIERALCFRQAGCHYITLGLETFNDRLLRLMGKGTTTALIDRVLSNLAWAGLPVSVYMIVGLPTETREEALESFQAIEKRCRDGLISSYIYYVFQITPYSDIFDNPGRYGISRMIVPDGLDLDPPVFDFDGEGMPRETVARLAARFNAAAGNIIHSQGTPIRGNGITELNLSTGTLKLNYDVIAIGDAHQQVNHAFANVSLSEWLDGGEHLIPPIKRFR
jgi:anaerobic magnesium-protoporphyrin IX monomethyl ester cyclase